METYENADVGLPGTSHDLWAMPKWAPHFPDRASLLDELALLDRLFPFEWRAAELGKRSSRHQLRGDIATVGGRTRLVALAAELLRTSSTEAGAQIPMQGRLRCPSLYEPTKSELLVGPILRPVGHVTWQPQGAGHGADYQVGHGYGVHVAEVKRLCTSLRQEKVTMERLVADWGRSGPVFAPDENVENAREDARRLYPRVRHAARQIEQSASKATRRVSRPALSVPGILFLDLDGNPYLVNLRETIRGWMAFDWAQPIDLICFFDYAHRDGAWCTIVEPIYSRSHRALDTLGHVLPYCSRGHFHVGKLPTGPCEFPLPM